jgi:tripartite ATP-independent transporter DctM subunit
MFGGYEALIGFVVLFALMLLRVPVGIAMGVVGVCGFAFVVDWEPALRTVSQATLRSATDEGFGLVPLFVLMGTLASASGLGRELFTLSNAFAGHKRGGLAVATIWASAGFSAICGSAVAAAATMARIVLPEMRRVGYDGGFACATIATGGTLGILIPPSVVFALYGIMTEQDIAKLFMAGVVPGLLAVVIQILCVRWITARNPEVAPAGPVHDWAERRRAIGNVWAVVLLFVFMLGGLYAGAFTTTEAAAMGAGGALIIGMVRRRFNRPALQGAFFEAVRTTGGIFLVIMGAVLFSQFLTLTRAPQEVADWVGNLQMNRYLILAIIIAVYIVLGALMDELAMILLTVPIVYPIIVKLGFDPIWFGVILVMVVQLGLIIPPVAMNLFVLQGIAKTVPLKAIYHAVMPFVVGTIVLVVILCAFPQLALWLPQSMG